MQLYLDDDCDRDYLIAIARKAGHTVVSPREIGMRGSHDAVHFRESILRHVVLLTRNGDDFRCLHELVLTAGGHHSGVILVCSENDPRRDFSMQQIVHALARLEAVMPNLADQLVILNQWR